MLIFNLLKFYFELHSKKKSPPKLNLEAILFKKVIKFMDSLRK